MGFSLSRERVGECGFVNLSVIVEGEALKQVDFLGHHVGRQPRARMGHDGLCVEAVSRCEGVNAATALRPSWPADGRRLVHLGDLLVHPSSACAAQIEPDQATHVQRHRVAATHHFGLINHPDVAALIHQHLGVA